MRILGIDYGRKKLGTALGDTETGLVQPLMVLPTARCTQTILALIKTNDVRAVAVGLPGGKLDAEVKKFGEKLAQQISLPISFIDETLSTQEAQRLMREMGRRKKSRLNKEDAIAAAIMLQYFLEGGAHV